MHTCVHTHIFLIITSSVCAMLSVYMFWGLAVVFDNQLGYFSLGKTCCFERESYHVRLAGQKFSM